MTASAVGYDRVHAWVKVMLGRTHTTVARTVAWAVLCILLAQRVTPAALARALPAEQAGRARARLTCVRRWWTGPPLDPVVVSPQLIQVARALLPSGSAVVVALDTTRLGPWEVWLAGIVVAGRTLPIGWAVIPYPWPKGRLRITTIALIQRLQTVFPSGVPWSLVAGWVVVSAAVALPPKHKQNLGTVRERAKRTKVHAQHHVGKEHTQTIESKHINLRTRIKRFVRRTICFSKTITMHDLVIGLCINRYEFGGAI
jgi:IS1 transposase